MKRTSAALPPHDLDAELAALACVLDCDQPQAKAYFAQLEERHFYGVQTLTFFRSLTKIEADGGRFDPVTLAEQLKLDGQFVNVGGIKAIAAGRPGAKCCWLGFVSRRRRASAKALFSTTADMGARLRQRSGAAGKLDSPSRAPTDEGAKFRQRSCGATESWPRS